MPTVDADAGTAPKDSTVDEDTTDDESLSEEDQQVKKKQKREKVGFRDRKVNHCCLCLHCQKHPTLQISYRFVYDFLFFFLNFFIRLNISYFYFVSFSSLMWNQNIPLIDNIHDARSLNMKTECEPIQRPIKSFDILLPFE